MFARTYERRRGKEKQKKKLLINIKKKYTNYIKNDGECVLVRVRMLLIVLDAEKKKEKEREPKKDLTSAC